MVRVTRGKKGDEPSAVPNVEQPTGGSMSLADQYAELEAAALARATTGAKASDMLGTVEQIFQETGREKLIFSSAATIVSQRVGKKIYNQLRSAVLAKSSPYDLVDGEDGHKYIVRK